MQQRVHNTKQLEVLLGVIGVIYLFVLVVGVVILVRFLVANSIDAVKEAKNANELPQTYNIQGAENILKP